MKRFTRCPTCGASVRTENMPDHTRRVHAESHDSGEVAGAKRLLMTRTKIDTYDRRYARGCRFVERDEFKKAIRILQKIPEDYPDIADVYSLIAISYMGLKRSDDALIYFEKAVTAAAREWSHWCNLANSYIMHRRISNAVECLDMIYRIGYPSDAKDAVDELKWSITKLLEAALSEKPYLDAETCLALEDRFQDGVTYMNNKDWDRAIVEFEYVVGVDQASEKAYGNLGIAYLFKGRFDEAERCFDKALEIKPEYPHAARNLAVLYEVREKASKDPEYLKELEDYMQEVHF
jgi:Flp pilus assembly protein TadD